VWDTHLADIAAAVGDAVNAANDAFTLWNIQKWGYVTRHKSHVTRHTSHVTRHTSHVTRHTSHVTRHTSHVTRHLSHDMPPSSFTTLSKSLHPPPTPK
jgi:hypothetical protein